MVSSLGASATPISYNELYSSLQTGIVDGADNPLKGILNMSFYEVGSYVLDMSHQYEASVIIINSDFFNSLSEEDQAVINEAMEEGAEYFKQISDEALEGYRSQLEEKGMELLHLMIRRSGKMRRRLSIRNLQREMKIFFRKL